MAIKVSNFYSQALIVISLLIYGFLGLLLHISGSIYIARGGQYLRRPLMYEIDTRFFSSSNLYPYDLMVYIPTTILFVYLIYRRIKQQKFDVGMMILIALLLVLPLVFMKVVESAGFNISECRSPSSYWPCYYPDNNLIIKIFYVPYAIITSISILLIFFAFVLNSRNYQPSKN